jgi:hypothetical protein
MQERNSISIPFLTLREFYQDNSKINLFSTLPFVKLFLGSEKTIFTGMVML